MREEGGKDEEEEHECGEEGAQGKGKQHQPNVPVVVQEKSSQDVYSQNLWHK